MADDTEENDDFDPFDDNDESKSGEEESTDDDKSEEESTDDDEKEPEPPSGEDEKKESKSVPVGALKAERSARQSLQSEVERLRSKYEPDEEEPDPAEDPEAYKEYVQRKTQSNFRQQVVNSSRDRVLDAHPEDAQEKFNAFRLLSAGSKEIVEEFDNHPDPGQFAYDKGKEYLDDLYGKALEKAKASLKVDDSKDVKDTKTESDKRKDAAAGVPDLTGSTAAGSNTEPLETMDEDLFEDSPFR